MEDLIKAVKTPLSFFVLVVLIAEGPLYAILLSGNISDKDRSIIIYAMIAVIFLTVIVFAIITYKKPQSFAAPNASLSELDKIEYADIVGIFSGRSVTIEDEYSKRLEKMKQNLDIIGFGLSHFRKDYGSLVSPVTVDYY